MSKWTRSLPQLAERFAVAVPLVACCLGACVEPWGTRIDDDDSVADPTPEPTPESTPEETPEPTPDSTPAPDLDGDGVPSDLDCDDQDPDVGAAEAEICDGLDQDCDGEVDEGLPPHNYWVDGDGDGYGDPSTTRTGCAPLPGEVLVSGDCDDADPAVHVGSSQQIDGTDSDCDGLTDWHLDVWITVDDAFEWCFDEAANILGSGTSWAVGYHYDVWAETGSHVIGIRGWDTGMVITAGIADIRMSDGTTWVTDGTWKFDPAPSAPPDSRAGWCTPGFDDSSWQFANVLGPIGVSPWGAGPQPWAVSSPAQWVWDYFPVNLNTQFLRKEIVLP